MLTPLSPVLKHLDTAVRAAKVLVKTASSDDDVFAIEAGRRVMRLTKKAGADLPTINALISKALKGLAVSAGAAIPAAAVGSYMASKMTESSAAEAQKTRDFIENAALSLAGAGLGLYALHNVDEPPPVGTNDYKMAEFHQEAQQELIEKLATIGAIDAQLDTWVPKDESGQKVAAAMRRLNDGFLIQLLSEVIGA